MAQFANQRTYIIHRINPINKGVVYLSITASALANASKILTPTAFKVIQQQAQAMIEDKVYENEEHKKWLEKIANGQMPYGYSIELPKKED